MTPKRAATFAVTAVLLVAGVTAGAVDATTKSPRKPTVL